MRVRAAVSAPAGQEYLDGPHQVPAAASEDELQDRRLVSGEDLLEDLQRRPVGPQAEGQVDGPGQALDQDALLPGADGILLRTVTLSLLLGASSFGDAVSALLRLGEGLWRLRGVAGVWFGSLWRTDGFLLLLTGAAAVFTPGHLVSCVLCRLWKVMDDFRFS